MSRIIPGPEGVSIAHAAAHVLGAGDAIDGDRLGIDWNPANYTPAVTPAEVTSIDHLTAHLYGIDQALGGAITDHGGLTGLADDDHVGYVLASGARAMTGTLTVPGIVSPGPNSDLPLTPAGSGDLILDGVNWPQADGTSGQVMQTDGAGQLSYISLGAIELARIAGSTFSTVQHLQDIFHSPGWVSGGSITDDADGTITVAAGTGLIRAINGQTDTIFYMDWAAESGANVALTASTMHWVYVEYNAGAPRVVARTTKSSDFQRDVLLGSVYRNGANVLHITEESRHQVGDHAGAMIRRMKEVAPFARVSGGVLSEAGTRNIAVTGGNWWQGLSEFATTALDTSAAGTFIYAYQDGIGGWTLATAQTQINNTQYDDGSGALATLSNNQYGVHWVYVENDSSYYVIYGRGDYTLSQAQDAPVPANVPPWFDESHARLIGKIVIQESTASFTSTESVFDATFDPAVPTDHGGLAGLPDDDHLQYLPIAGTRAMTGALLAFNGTALLPGVAFDGEPSTGVYLAAAGDLRHSIAGTYRQRLTATNIQFNMSSSSTVPIVVRAANTNTGLGWPAINEASIITAGTEAVRWDAGQNQRNAANIYLQEGNFLVLDADEDTYIYSGGDDNLLLMVNGTFMLEATTNAVITGPTALRLQPNGDLATDLGRPATRWDNLYVQTGDIRTDAIGTAETVGLRIHNDTLATAGVNQQHSPMMTWEGSGWALTPVTDQAVVFAAQLEASQGSTLAHGQLAFKASINGGAYTDIFKLNEIGQALASDGLVGTPGYSFHGLTTMGMYRSGNDLRFALSGSTRLSIAASGAVLVGLAGNEGIPTLANLTDIDTGLYWVNPNILGLTTGGSAAAIWNATQDMTAYGNILPDTNDANFLGSLAQSWAHIYTQRGITITMRPAAPWVHTAGKGQLWVRNDTPCVLVWQDDNDVDHVLTGPGATLGHPDPHALSDGLPTATAYGFSDSAGLGMYATASGLLRFAVANGYRLSLSTSQLLLNMATSVTVPALTLAADPNSGFGWFATDQVGVITAGTEAIRWNATQQTLVPDGSESAPSYSFASIPATGIRATIGALTLVEDGVDAIGMSNTMFFRTKTTTQVAEIYSFRNEFTLTQSTGDAEFMVLDATWNSTSTAGSNMFEIRSVDTGLGSGEHYFINCKVGATWPASSTSLTRFAVLRSGPTLNYIGGSSDPGIAFVGERDTGFFAIGAGGQLSGSVSAVETMRLDDDATAGNTRFMIYDVDNATLERVTVGSADSGGTNFKLLRIPN